MVPALVEAIKAQGLVLVVDRSAEVESEVGGRVGPMQKLPEGIDGVLKGDGVLRFNESIDM
jgi:CDK inhibitor PHO81